MIEVNRQGEVWVYAEQEGGRLSDVPLELLSKGREIEDSLMSIGGKDVRQDRSDGDCKEDDQYFSLIEIVNITTCEVGR